ncbi:HNH endonuclease signature motif containing protein [Chryseobacterium indologenes]|uniref:HNH endonuclease n=1 Tax=Chryseobacterium indologenes TaxID=253 RepID=UPI0023E8C657|nr:HNH endonuclease signature motif containing protein [Chryseobacterium indologenes]WET50802.1 HNH endonuclease signature motif containing protein [Chryseobacterium indologenes]
MAISDKTRKFLWAKSGNRCAICKTELITGSDASEEFNVGEECHIISSKKNGPRYLANLEQYDNYENLLLLCRNHHTEIDELVDTYSEELLRYMKVNHENWVRTAIANAIHDNDDKAEKPRFLMRITSGKELLNIISEAHGYVTDYEELNDRDEAEYIGGIIQTFIDFGDICGMVEAYDKVQIGYDLQKLLDELEEKGYYVFGERDPNTILPHISGTDKWTVATLVIRKKENPEIYKVNL